MFFISKRFFSIGLIALLCVLTHCSKESINAVNVDLDKIPYDKLSKYGFFEGDIADLVPRDRVVPYDLITPLFTDYALKDRFIWLPEGSQAEYVSDGNVIEFPVGTVIIKNFKYHNVQPDNSTKIIETRLLVRKTNRWHAYTYQWNNNQTEATYLQVGKSIPISWYEGAELKETVYKIPTSEECKTCHRFDGDVSPIGPKPQNLNKDYSYDSGLKNQLEHWNESGYLDVNPTVSITLADWSNDLETLESRARAYLDVNCAHCHNAFGSATNTSLYYNIEIIDEDILGFCKTPISAGGEATGGNTYDIVPGNADSSILIYRLSSTVSEVAMPELGRSINHDEGIDLLRAWINSLPPDPDCN